MSNVAIVKSAYEAFGRGDVEALLGMFDPAIEWREAENNPYQPSGDPWIGGEAIVQNLFAKIPEDWDGFAVVPENFHDAGDTVIMEGRYKGTHKSTGKSMNPQVCHIWKVRSGKLASFQQYVDTAQLKDVMG